MIKLCDKEFQRLESVDWEEWNYFNSISSRQELTLKSVGIYSSSKNNYFSIDTIDSNGRFYRYVYRYSQDSDIPAALTRWAKVDWSSLLNQTIRFEHYGNLYLLRNKENKLVAVNYYGESQRINVFFDKISVKDIENIEINDDKEFLIKYKEKDDTYYLGSEDIISANGLEGKEINNKLYYFAQSTENNDEDKFIKILAEHFGRTKEEIESFAEAKIAGSTELKKYIKYINNELKNPGDLVGAFSHGGFGQAVIWNGNEWIDYPTDDANLFNIIGHGRIPTSDIVLLLANDGSNWRLVDNDSEPIRKKILEEINNKNIFKNYLSGKTERVKLFVRFEDISSLARSFYSYYFTLTTDTGQECSNYNRISLLRYLMYIKHVANIRMNQEKHKKAIESAIAAIMSRNMSHNLGSHFLYYSQQDFANLSGSLHDMFYETGKPKEEIFVQKNGLKSLLDQTEKSYEYTKGASKVFEFLQDRMYYLAAITGIERSQSLPVLLKSQVLDFFTEKTDYRNLYLNNLVRSEQYTLDSETLSVKLDSGSKDLDDLSISLPLGSVSIHAIYNIFENFIRNSAKYQWAGIPKPTSLVFTIKVVENGSDIIIQIFDNKTSANCPNNKGVTLIDYMSAKLQNIRFLDADDSLNNDDKGLKEMLLSAFWINNRQKDKSIGKIIYDFEKSGNKEAFLKKYGLVFVADSNEKDGNLGVEFHVNKHYYVLRQDEIKDKPYLTSDIVIVSDAESREYEYGREIPSDARVVTEAIDVDKLRNYVDETPQENGSDKEEYTATKDLLYTIQKKLGNIDSITLEIDGAPEYNFYDSEEQESLHPITFSDHMSSDSAKLGHLAEIYSGEKKYSYYDSLSGDNYTHNLRALRPKKSSIDKKRKYKTWRDKYQSLLIKESALTRITIVDERFFNSIEYLNIDKFQKGEVKKIKGTSLELDLKNIQVINFKEEVIAHDSGKDDTDCYSLNTDNFIGNEFRDEQSVPHFMSIHFGIIQKMLKKNKTDINAKSVKELISLILNELYPGKSVDNIRVSIHTGRGSMSEGERKALSSYNIIPLGSLRSAFFNSKFILNQLFYSLQFTK